MAEDDFQLMIHRYTTINNKPPAWTAFEYNLFISSIIYIQHILHHKLYTSTADQR